MMLAVREAGNSLRRTRVNWRWLGGWEDDDEAVAIVVAVAIVAFEVDDDDVSGVKDRDHASPLRNKTFDTAPTLLLLLTVLGPWKCSRWLVAVAEMCLPVARIDVRLASSHWVSHSRRRKASLATIPRSTSKLVLTPSIYVSSNARLAFLTMSSQLGAVMMIFAIRLSKSVPMTAIIEGRRCVSTRTPFPVGNLKELILPMLKVQWLDTSSAVTRSCREYTGGGFLGSVERWDRDREGKESP